MKSHFKEFFEYHHQINQKLIEQLIEHEGHLTDKIHLLISHNMNAHQIWNARILGNDKVPVFEVRSLIENRKLDDENLIVSLAILNDKDLNDVIFYKNSEGVSFSSSIEEIFYHVVNHHSHHRGQITAELKAIGIQPIITDYIFYTRQEL